MPSGVGGGSGVEHGDSGGGGAARLDRAMPGLARESQFPAGLSTFGAGLATFLADLLTFSPELCRMERGMVQKWSMAQEEEP